MFPKKFIVDIQDKCPSEGCLKRNTWPSSFFIALLGLTLFFQACKKNDNPAAPTVTPPAGPIIVGSFAQNGIVSIMDVTVSDSTGNTGTANTGVTVFSNGVTIPLTRQTLALLNTAPVTILGAPLITGWQYNNGSVTYTAGQVYEFQVNIDGTTYSASTTAIAGNPVVQPSSGSAGVTCSWTNGVGNRSCVRIVGSSFNTYIGPILSSNPYIIPNSAFTNETPGAGNDGVNLDISQFSSSAFPGAQASSCLISSNVASVGY